MDAPTGAFYGRKARDLASAYERAHPDHLARLDRAFASAQRLLDVGCGSGRDCLHLLRQGKDVHGVDASPEMLAESRALYEREGLRAEGRLFQAALPNLDAFKEGEYDGVLCSAVLMHLPDESVFDAVYSLRRVLRIGGTLVVSVPSQRSDVDPITRRDADGRLFSNLPPAKLRLLFERIGFEVRSSEEAPDSLGRPGVTWNVTVFTRLDESNDRPLNLVEGILNRDKKVATYKLALFRALAEIAQTQHHLATFTAGDKVLVPLSAVAEKWILYYWPIFASDTMILQGTSSQRSDVAIRPSLNALIEHYRSVGGLSAFYVDWKSDRFNPHVRRLLRVCLTKFKGTIWNMPARHAGGGEFSVFGYDPASQSLSMSAPLWRELCLTGYWIRDATLLRWAELTEQLNDGIRASQVLDHLLTIPDAERNVADARHHFLSLRSRACVWTERSLDDAFAVDHAMPFALWRNNDLWNLFPTDPRINGKKSDRLPTYRLLHQRRDRIIDYWRGLNGALGGRFQREAQTLLGRDRFEPRCWENRLFAAFVEAFETTALQRGVPRWEPAAAGSIRIFSAPSAVSASSTQPQEHFTDPGPASIEQRWNLVPFHQLGPKNPFRTHLPLVGALAAGPFFHGFETKDLTDTENLDWVEVPAGIAKAGRFVVRVAGDSMAPTLEIGDLAVFEYHRSPRYNSELVIANMPEFGAANDGTEAIKRIKKDPEHWIFCSDNPAYSPVTVRKDEAAHPILGTFVMKL
jgi:SAM-dependent methyltransferase/SOS-response transcriptional repressor LexA